jgi:hypothetical protein
MEEFPDVQPSIPDDKPVPRRRTKKVSWRELKLLDYGLKCTLGLIIVTVFLTAVQCSLKKPESPTWSTQLVVPMVNRTYYMPEIIDKIDQPNIYLDSSGAVDRVMFSYTQEIDTIRVSDNLTTSDISHDAAEVLGTISITPDNPNPVSINLSDYVSIDPGIGIPPISFDITEDLPSLGTFNSATIASGAFDITVTNDFGLDLDTVIINLFDITNATTLSYDTLLPPGIPAGNTDTVTVNLAGETLSNNLRLLLHCFTPGAGPSFTLGDKTMAAAVEIDNGLTVSSATTEVPAMTRLFTEAVELGESNIIESAALESGDLSIQVANGSELQADFRITLVDFTQSGNPLVINRALSPNSSYSLYIDLTGYLFEPVDQTAPQLIAVNVVANVDSTAPNMVNIDQYDSLSVSADITNLAFSSMTGVIQPTGADFDAISLDVEVPEGFDSLQLVDAVLTLEIENGVRFPGTLDLVITGNNGQSINLSGSIAAGDPSNPVTTIIQDNTINDFLYPMPSNITVGGAATFGDGLTSGTVTSNDYIFSGITIDAPLKVIIPDSTTVDGDISSEEIDQTDIDIITDHLIEASFNSTISNHLPLGITVELYLDPDSTRLNPDDAELVVGPISVDAGTTDAGGTVIAAVESDNLITLDSTETRILENAEIYIGQLITLHSTNGQPVVISGDDYYSVQAVIEVEYLFDGEF